MSNPFKEILDNTPGYKHYFYRYKEELRLLIDRLRQKKGYSQKELSDKSGVAEQTLSNILHAGSNMKLETIAKLSDALGEDLINIDFEKPYKEDINNEPLHRGRSVSVNSSNKNSSSDKAA